MASVNPGLGASCPLRVDGKVVDWMEKVTDEQYLINR
jgi:hypothetical protein